MLFKLALYDDFTSALENNLIAAEQAPFVEKHTYNERAIKHLLAAAEIFDEIGLEKQASNITKILEKLANSDPATNGLTSDKMLSNLEEKGWVFNVDDGEIIDVADPDPGEIISIDEDGEIEISDPEDLDESDLDIKYLLKKK